MRLPIPPDWRAAARLQPWTLVAVAAGLAGAAWMLSPAAVAERARKAHDRIEGRPPNATGRALGYAAGVFASPPIDPLEVLTRRAVVARAGSPAPEYRGGAGDYFRPYLPTMHKATWPMPAQRLGGLGAQAPFRGQPIHASPAVSRTAAEVLAAQRGGSASG